MPLQVLAGQLPATISRSALLNDFIVPDYLSAGLPVSMVSRRPDVRSNEMALMAANAQVGVAQANMYPALNITAGAGLESFKSSNWFNISRCFIWHCRRGSCSTHLPEKKIKNGI